MARAGAKPQRGPRKDGLSPKEGPTGLLLEVPDASGRKPGYVAGHKPDSRPHSGKDEHAMMQAKAVAKSQENVQNI